MVRGRRRQGPGLVGLAARTAVVAGTATAVSGAMSGGQKRKAQAAHEQEMYRAAQQQAQIDAAAQAAAAQYAAAAQQQADAAAQAQAAAQAAAAAAPPPAAAPAVDVVAELQKLAALKDAGVLTDDEFAAAKAKLLG